MSIKSLWTRWIIDRTSLKLSSNLLFFCHRYPWCYWLLIITVPWKGLTTSDRNIWYSSKKVIGRYSFPTHNIPKYVQTLHFTSKKNCTGATHNYSSTHSLSNAWPGPCNAKYERLIPFIMCQGYGRSKIMYMDLVLVVLINFSWPFFYLAANFEVTLSWFGIVSLYENF